MSEKRGDMKRPKVLFQEPFVPRDVTFGKFSKGAGNNTFPYGVASIASYIRERGYDVSYLDPVMEQMAPEKYIEYIRANKIDLIGIGSTTLQISHVLDCFRLIRKHFPDVITVLGGVHATLMPEETLESTDVIDYLVLGEGERPFSRLLECLSSNDRESIKKIVGICFRDRGNLVHNPPDFNDCLTPEEMPVPLFEIFPMKQYVAQITYSKTFPTYSLVASRGCPFNCSFCNASDTLGRKMRYKPVDILLKEIRLLKEQYGARGIMFLDSTFTVNKAWVREFCAAYVKSGLDLPWACNSRVDTIDRDLAVIMRDAGCWTLLFGIESGNQKSLDLINKKTTVEQNTRAIRLCMELGLYVYTSYIICLPGETEEDALNTINYARSMGNHLAMFYLPVPYPKTRLWDTCKEMGGLRQDAKWSDFNSWDYTNPVYVNPLIGKEKMMEIYRHAYIRFYSNPRVWYNNFKEIILLRHSPYRYIMGLRSLLDFLLNK